MAKDLHTLIRLNEWAVDQRRRELGEVIGSLADLEHGLERLREELAKEQKIVLERPDEAGFFYGNYAEALIGRRDALEAGIQQMEHNVALARERLNEAYRDLKKYEIAQEHRDTRKTRERNARETEILNELGAQAHQRRRVAQS